MYPRTPGARKQRLEAAVRNRSCGAGAGRVKENPTLPSAAFLQQQTPAGISRWPRLIKRALVLSVSSPEPAKAHVSCRHWRYTAVVRRPFPRRGSASELQELPLDRIQTRQASWLGKRRVQQRLWLHSEQIPPRTPISSSQHASSAVCSAQTASQHHTTCWESFRTGRNELECIVEPLLIPDSPRCTSDDGLVKPAVEPGRSEVVVKQQQRVGVVILA
jgi:hypothetical protein